MALTTLMAADIARLIAVDDGATSIEYREQDGRRVTLTANVWDSITEHREVRGIQTLMTIRNITFSRTDLSTINMRSSFVVGSDEYAVARIIYQDDYLMTVEVQRHELHEHARPGYRRQ